MVLPSSLSQSDRQTSGASAPWPAGPGHRHGLDRAGVSRRRFLALSAGATGMAIGAGIVGPGAAFARGRHFSAARPIPGGIEVNGQRFHVFEPEPGKEPSTITDFDGVVGVAHLSGEGTGTDTRTGRRSRLIYDVDMRFMDGTYVGFDGHRHDAVYGFV